jgi:hypothetical protein
MATFPVNWLIGILLSRGFQFDDYLCI